MRILIILNDAPYGGERTYNGLRLTLSLLKADRAAQIAVFLMGDAVVAAKAGQKPPAGYYNIERMLHRAVAGGGKVLLCGTCMDARGLRDAETIEGAERSTMDVLSAETAAADKVIVF